MGTGRYRPQEVFTVIKKPHKLFELLVVGGGLWIVSGCGGQIDQKETQQRPSIQRTLPDGGVPDGGEFIGNDPSEGNGSGFW